MPSSSPAGALFTGEVVRITVATPDPTARFHQPTLLPRPNQPVHTGGRVYSKTVLFEPTGTCRWTGVHASGRTKHPAIPPFERFRPFPFSRRSRPCASTLSAVSALPQVTAGCSWRVSGRKGSLSPVGQSPAGRGPRLVRPFGAILPTALRLWAPPSNTAEGGHAILGPLPLRLLCPPGCPSVFS